MGHLKVRPTRDGLEISIGILHHTIGWDVVDKEIVRLLPGPWRPVVGMLLRTLEGRWLNPHAPAQLPPSVKPVLEDTTGAHVKAATRPITVTGTRPA